MNIHDIVQEGIFLISVEGCPFVDQTAGKLAPATTDSFCPDRTVGSCRQFRPVAAHRLFGPLAAKFVRQCQLAINPSGNEKRAPERAL